MRITIALLLLSLVATAVATFVDEAMGQVNSKYLPKFTKMPKHKNDYEGVRVQGRCCVVWDAVNQRCLQGKKRLYGNQRRECVALNDRPTGVPEHCFVWNIDAQQCLEEDDGRLDGWNYSEGEIGRASIWWNMHPTTDVIPMHITAADSITVYATKTVATEMVTVTDY